MDPATNHRARARKGQVLIIWVLVPIMLAAIAVFCIDVGMVSLSKARLQNAADSAARAAVLEFWEQRVSGAAEDAARDAGRQEGASFMDLNYCEAGSWAVFGVWDGNQFAACPTSVPANACSVRGFRSAGAPGGPLPTSFAGIFGIDTVSHEAHAVARFAPAKLTPFCIWEGEIPEEGESVAFYNDTEVAPGAFGLLDFDGGENSASDLAEWTRYGYKGPFHIDPSIGNLFVEGCTGLKSSLSSAIFFHISEGDQITICIYRGISGQGSLVVFEVIGFAGVVLEGESWRDKKQEEYDSVTARLVSKYIPGTGETEGPMRDFMRLQLVE